MRVQPDRRLAVAVFCDVFAVVVFVAIGRRNHDEGSALRSVLETALPFLVALGAAWLIARAWRHPMAVLTGITIWPITVLAGMVTRRVVFDRGTATSFVIVATVFLGVCFVGWRAVAQGVSRVRAV
jgi:uncharacterized membrane protein (GlpM family)